MFTNFAADGRRHYSPQTTWRRSLRGDAAVDKAAMWLGWVVSFLLFPFYRDLTCAALLPWSQRPGLSYCNNEGRGSGSAGLLAAALVEPELLASTGLLLWSGGRAVTLPAEEPPPVFDLRLQSRLLAAATGVGAGAGEEAAASASVEELLDPAAYADASFVVAATSPPPALASLRDTNGRAGHDRPLAASRRPQTAAEMRLRTMSCLAARICRLGSL